MTKFERVLSDPQLISLASIANPFLHADSEGDFYISETGQNVDFDDVMALLRKIEQATVKAFKEKLAEQEPVAYLYDDEAYGINSWDISDYIRQHGQSLYAKPCVEPMSDKPSCDSQNGKSGVQIPDGTLINEGTKEQHRTVKNLTAGPTHITKLSLSVDTKEAQALLQSYLGSLKDWQLVPKEPSRKMLRKMFYETFGMDGIEEEYLAARYRNMLSAFPKYAGDSNE